MKLHDVCATGLGCVSAAGINVAENLRSLYSGTRSPKIPQRIAAHLDRTFPVFEITSDQERLIREKSENDLSLTSLFALIAAQEACLQARLEQEHFRNLKIGVCLGSTVGCTLNNEPFYKHYREKTHPTLEPIRKFLNENPAQVLARAFGCKGPIALIANACSAGTDAIGLSKSWIQQGFCDVVLAGGTDELCRVTYLGFISLLISSEEPCRPFDINRTGLNLGEGAGICVLERGDCSKKRGTKPLAILAGYGCSADAYHPTGPHPEGRGLRHAIAKALAEADITPDSIKFINTHGTSTPDNDRVEGKVLAEIFSPGIPAVSTKSFTGHTLGAAGAIEAVFTICALLDQKLPATTGFREPDPECGIIPTTNNMDIDAEFGLSDSLAFGGNNSALVFQKGTT